MVKIENTGFLLVKAQITNSVRGVLIRVVSIRSLTLVYGWKRYLSEWKLACWQPVFSLRVTRTSV